MGPDHLGKDCGVRVPRTHFHPWSVQGEDVDKAIEPNGECPCQNH